MIKLFKITIDFFLSERINDINNENYFFFAFQSYINYENIHMLYF